MSSVPNIYERWSPETESDRALVVVELEAILASHHFRNSKRYPALLSYVVTRTLGGHAEQLKERTLGIEVFDRPADYDTNLDPVVRISASEVRKRIAQFYRDESRERELEIDLPLGTYVPEFKLRVSAAGEAGSEAELGGEDEKILESGSKLNGFGRHEPRARSFLGRARVLLPPWFWAGALLFAILAGATAFHRWHTATITEKMFKPLIKAPGSVQIVLGNGLHDVRTPPDPQHELLVAQLHGAYNRVSVCDTVAVSRLAAALGMQTKAYEIKEADLSNLQDLRQRPTILIGAYNNLWTMRLMEPLRFYFVKDGHGVRLVDARDPAKTYWSVDYTTATSSTISDYAIVARYLDPTTNGTILIIAGIGAYGTQAAGEAVTTPMELEKLVAGLPHGWEDANVELVLKTNIIHGEAGPAQLVASTTW